MVVTLGRGQMQQKPGCCHGLMAVRENNSSNSKENRNGDRAELFLLSSDLKVVSHWVSL